MQSLGSTFDIVINYSGDPAYQSAFDAAAARWEQIITGEIPDVGAVDDLVIDASIVFIDGTGSVLGQAGPDQLRSDSSLPYHGVMQFDSADIAQMAANGTLTNVILHEMGHVLGIGTIWDDLDLRTSFGFTGQHALAEYRALTGNPGATSVPLETGGGSGTAGSHWSEAVFNAELMTGFIESAGTPMPISRMTIGSLEDLGYTVSYGVADPFALPPSTDDYADSVADTSAPFGFAFVNGSATGTLELPGDRDWFRVDLTGGAAYTITLAGSGTGAGTLSDPYLRVYNAAGVLLAFDDDSDGNLNSRVTLTASGTGTFFISAGAYNDQHAGTYAVRITGPAQGGGTLLADFLDGSDGPDTVTAMDGNDTVVGRGGNDFLYGNPGNDSVDSGSGDNTVWAGQGDDFATGDGGNNFLWGNEGADTLLSGNGNNTIVGGDGSIDGGDLIASGAGSDLIWGNGGADTIGASTGANTVIGGFGNDTLTTGSGNDFIFGNQDNDTIDAGDGANLAFGGFGDDRVATGTGADTIWGNEGNDLLAGGAGADRYTFATGSGLDRINGFNVGEGDRLDIQGQSFTQGTAGDGDVLLTLSGGGTIELNGINPGSFSTSFFA
jgi:Ca2+-binding RTX toxin-like protein